ncbi:MAG: hypothetical protein WCQ16_09065 [Verrucomicrobiae bacterium]
MQAVSPSLSAARDSIQLPIFRRVAPEQKVVSAPKPEATVASGGVPPVVHCVDKLVLEDLAAGDKVVVKTANTTYNLEMAGDLRCKVIPGKSSARSGDAVLVGGLNADASEHTPNRVFVGGRLAYQFPDEEHCILTSVVESIFWVRAGSVPTPPAP